MSDRIERVNFTGSQGATLSARLDRPAGPPRAMALFAHCFTCSKDVKAASRIAAGLTSQHIAVLRFDFTGLGASDGEFANTDFSSNVDDLIAAADWLRAEHQAPQILIGHSFGGAAVLSAARRIPEVSAVATVAAPSALTHLEHLFEGESAEIERTGAAQVCLAGRTFEIRQDFVENLRSTRLTDEVAELGTALMVMHSPIDDLVGVEHARSIYDAAKHPKSFVGVDRADHLLTGPADAAFVADMIGAWANRYTVDRSGRTPAPAGSTSQVLVAETNQGPFLNHVSVGEHCLLADEPVDIGGFDAGPGPYELVSAGLGACTSMTMRMYADRKDFPLDRAIVEVDHEKVDAPADPDGAESSGKVDQFTRRITLEGPLDDDQRRRILGIANRCPVHRTLEASSSVITELVTPD